MSKLRRKRSRLLPLLLLSPAVVCCWRWPYLLPLLRLRALGRPSSADDPEGGRERGGGEDAEEKKEEEEEEEDEDMGFGLFD